MQFKFQQLIRNPLLDSNDYKQINSGYLTNILSDSLKLPLTTIAPFIFSCFALSVDGKLCYPDTTSGYAITTNNYQATAKERYADWWNLLLGRTISDAVIVGANSLLLENFNYQAKIDVAELVTLRQQLNKPKHLLHIIITRDCNKLNLMEELIANDNAIPLLIYTTKASDKLPANFSSANLADLTLERSKQIVVTKELNILALINKLFSLNIKVILNESPYYHHQLQDLKLLNEAWLNTSTVYIGGQVTGLGKLNPAFNSTNHPHYTILTLHTINYNFLYSRYQISYTLRP